MGDVSDKARKWLDRRLPQAMEALGIRCAGMVTQELDTPYPPASVPGESPHRRTGNLQSGVEHTESESDATATTTIRVTRAKASPSDGDNVPIILEEYLDRPILRPIMNEAETLVPISMRRSFDGGVPTYESAG
jgi:hypothetical protein